MSTQQMTKTLSSTIAGERAEGGARTISSVNPANVEQTIAEVQLGNGETYADAARTAKQAHPEWAAMPAPVRGQVVANIARLVGDNKDRLAACITDEVGKTTVEALGEVQEVIDTCEFFLGEGRRLYGMTIPSEMPSKQLMTFRAPGIWFPPCSAVTLWSGSLPSTRPLRRTRWPSSSGTVGSRPRS